MEPTERKANGTFQLHTFRVELDRWTRVDGARARWRMRFSPQPRVVRVARSISRSIAPENTSLELDSG